MIEPVEAFLDADCVKLLADEILSAAVPRQADECADKTSTQKKGYRDLEQNVRASNAAEESAWLSYQQAQIALVGAALLIWTLGATAWAAWAAADAAQSAEASVDLSAANAQRELRSYVFVKKFVTEEERGPEKPSIYIHQMIPGVLISYQVGVEWENSGRTPARNVRCCINWETRASALPDDFDFPDTGTVEQTTIGPTSIFVTRKVTCSILELDPTYASVTFCYLYGWVDYDEVVDKTTRHRTEFCYRVTGRKSGSADVAISFRPHPRFNGSDEDCLKQPEPYGQT